MIRILGSKLMTFIFLLVIIGSFTHKAFPIEDETKSLSQFPASDVNSAPYRAIGPQSAFDMKWLEQNVISIISSWIALLGLFAVFFQLRRQSKSLSADLALRLDDKMGLHRQTYRELFEGGQFYDKVPDDKIEDIEFYLTFFDTLSTLVKDKDISLKYVNQMYGYRFLVAMHNPSVKNIVAHKNDSWEGLKELYMDVIRYRKKNKLEIPRNDNSWIYEQ